MPNKKKKDQGGKPEEVNSIPSSTPQVPFMDMKRSMEVVDAFLKALQLSQLV